MRMKIKNLNQNLKIETKTIREGIKFNIGLVSFRRLVSFRFKSDVSFVQIVGHVSNTSFYSSFVIRNYSEWVLRCGEVYVRPQYKKG